MYSPSEHPVTAACQRAATNKQVLVACTGSNVHALVRAVRPDASVRPAPARDCKLIPLASRTKAGLTAVAEAVATCPGASRMLVRCS